MITFKYSFIGKLIHRYANIPLTFLLLLYLLSSFTFMFQKWYYIFSVVLNVIIIIVLNRHYFKTYKYFPFRIEINNDKMICDDYFNKTKKVEIELVNIDEIEGGVISATPAKPTYIHDGKNDVVVGISPHLKESGKLLTIILSNIKKELYDSVLNRMKDINKLSLSNKKKPVK